MMTGEVTKRTRHKNEGLSYSSVSIVRRPTCNITVSMLRVLILSSVLIRVILVLLGTNEWLGDRVEVATSISSWSRSKFCSLVTKAATITFITPVKEGVAMKWAGLSPYKGDIYHQVQALVYYYPVYRLFRTICQAMFSSFWSILKAV